MTTQDLLALLPLIVSAYLPVMVLVVSAWWRNTTAIAVMALVSLAASFAAVFVALPFAPRMVTPLIAIDNFSLFFMLLIFAGTFAVALISRDYLVSRQERGDRFYALLLLAAFGAAVTASSVHFASFFLGLETLTVSLYGMIGFTRTRKESLEGSVKYLILAATSSAFLLFGIALVYFEFGTLDFRELHLGLFHAVLRAGASTIPGPAILGIALILVGFGFKLAFVPFHMWSPDVYQGAPAPATAFISTISKGALFALLFRFFIPLSLFYSQARELMLILAIATILVGNLLALLQPNIKRILAYSSIANMGYLLIPLLAGSIASFAFYLVSYFATVIAAFGVISVLAAHGEEIEDLKDYRGLARRSPFAAAVMTLAMLSLIGIPLTSGFLAKLYIFAAGIATGLWGLVIVAIIGSAISAYYYLRVLAAMYISTESAEIPVAPIGPWSAIGLSALSVVIVLLGIYPTPLIRLVETALR